MAIRQEGLIRQLIIALEATVQAALIDSVHQNLRGFGRMIVTIIQ